MKKYLLNLSIIIFIVLQIKTKNNNEYEKEIEFKENLRLVKSDPYLYNRLVSNRKNHIQKVKDLKKKNTECEPRKKAKSPNISNKTKNLIKSDILPKTPNLLSNDQNENTYLWTKFFKTKKIKNPKILKNTNEEDIGLINPNFNPNRMISYTLYFFFTLTSFYSIFFSFKSKRIFIAILSYYTSYYLLLFITTSINFDQDFQVVVQIFLFLGTICFGLVFIIFSYKTIFFRYIIFGFSIGSSISVIIAQFFIDFSENEDLVLFFTLYFLLNFTCSIICFFYYDEILLFFSSFVHSCICVFNISVIFGKVDSFENRVVFVKDDFFLIYVVVIFVSTIFGFLVQFFMRKKKYIMKEMEMSFSIDDSIDEEISTRY